MKERILLSLAHMGGTEKNWVDEAFRTNWIVPLGPNVDPTAFASISIPDLSASLAFPPNLTSLFTFSVFKFKSQIFYEIFHPIFAIIICIKYIRYSISYTTDCK